MAVPCHALDSHHGNVTPEAAEAFNQCYIRAGASCANCCRKPAWSRTDNKHVGFMNYINFADWLDNLVLGFRHVGYLSRNYNDAGGCDFGSSHEMMNSNTTTTTARIPQKRTPPWPGI